MTSHDDHWSRMTGWTAGTPAGTGQETDREWTAGDREPLATPAMSLGSIRFASVTSSTIRSGRGRVASLVSPRPTDAPRQHIVVPEGRIVWRTEAIRSRWGDLSESKATRRHLGWTRPYGPESASHLRRAVHLWAAMESGVVAM